MRPAGFHRLTPALAGKTATDHHHAGAAEVDPRTGGETLQKVQKNHVISYSYAEMLADSDYTSDDANAQAKH